MVKSDLAVEDPILGIFQLLVKVVLPKIETLHKIGAPTARSDFAIQFLLKFCFRNHLRLSMWSMGLRLVILVLDETKSQIDHTVFRQ